MLREIEAWRKCASFHISQLICERAKRHERRSLISPPTFLNTRGLPFGLYFTVSNQVSSEKACH